MSKDYPGAALMAAYAAQNSGCGYVRIFCPKKWLKTCQISHPSLIFVAYKNWDELWTLIDNESFDGLLIGSGWSQWKTPLPFSVNKNQFFVFDGGFLTPEVLISLAEAENTILTPHSGELNRMLQDSSDPQLDKVDKILNKTKALIIAKGFKTIITQQGKPPYITAWNSPSLATAGTGDILAGLTTSFCAQLKDLHQGALMAVDAHRLLAKNAPIAITPSQLLENIGPLLNSMSK